MGSSNGDELSPNLCLERKTAMGSCSKEQAHGRAAGHERVLHVKHRGYR